MSDQRFSYRKYFAIGLGLGILVAVLLFYLLVISGGAALTASPGGLILRLVHLARENLGYSIPFFLATFLVYIVCLGKLNRLVKSAPLSSVALMDAEMKVDLTINIFFGIGVLFTAVGMRNSLLAALGGLDAETAASRGAWFILRQLVDGGILLALSTTIVGGAGGYLMKVAKTWMVGKQLMQYYENMDNDRENRTVMLLEKIADLLGERQ